MNCEANRRPHGGGRGNSRRRGSAMVNSKVTKGERMRDAESYIRKKMTDHVFGLLESGFDFGDITWVRSDSNSWWPAQLLDEKGVSPSNKPRKKAESEFLVRVYGTCNYMYIDPVKNKKEFENVVLTLKQNNSSVSEMLLNTLEKDLPGIKLHCKTRRKSDGSSGQTDFVLTNFLVTEWKDREDLYHPDSRVSWLVRGAVEVRPERESVLSAVPANTEMLIRAERNGETDTAVSVRTLIEEDDGEGTKKESISSEMKNPKKYYTRRQNHRGVGRDWTLQDVKPDVNHGCGINWPEKFGRSNPLGLKLKKSEIRKQPITSEITDGTLLNRRQGIKRDLLKEETGGRVMQRGEKLELCPEVIRQEEVKEQNVMKEAEQAVNARKQRQHEQEEKSLSTMRRTKVMQKLALIAPSGSPFLKNEQSNLHFLGGDSSSRLM